MASHHITRRQALKTILAAGGGIGAAAFLPSHWLKPVVRSGVLPAHAQASAVAVSHGSQAFSYTGGQQTFTVPDGVTSVTIDAYGASGAGSGSNGKGAAVTGAVIAVTPGETLYIFVGGQGSSDGYNGGGGFLLRLEGLLHTQLVDGLVEPDTIVQHRPAEALDDEIKDLLRVAFFQLARFSHGITSFKSAGCMGKAV